jgi:methyl-accepting chemotaxis protein
MKMKIRTKLLVYILSVSILIYLISVGYVSVNLTAISYNSAKSLAISEAKKYANAVKADLDADLSVTRGVANVFQAYHQMPRSIWEPLFMEAQKNLVASNPDFIAFATSWEYAAIDSAYKKNHGRIQMGYYRTGKDFGILYKEKNMEADDRTSLYYQAKSQKIELLTDAYRDSYSGKAEDSILMASIVVPIVYENTFAGLAGVDISLERFQDMIGDIRPFPESFSFLVSNSGIFIAHPDPFKITGTILDEYTELDERLGMMEKIKNGISFSTEFKDIQGTNYFISFEPIFLDGKLQPWSIGIAVPLKVIYAETRENLTISIVVGFIGMIIMILVVFVTAGQISFPLGKATEVLSILSKGDILNAPELPVKSEDEIGKISESVNILVNGLSKMAKYADEIGKGNFDAPLDMLSNKDVIAATLINMSHNLSRSKDEEETRRKQEREEVWVSHGIANVSSILRNQYTEFDTFSKDVLSSMVKYIEGKVAAIYIVEQDTTLPEQVHLRQTASFGADEILSQRIDIRLREGIIGRAVSLKSMVMLDPIPKDYYKIASGLGRHTPKYVYAFPFVFNDECLGAIELGEMNPLEDYKIDFINRICESIAITILRLGSGFETTRLLQASQINAANLEEKEEELNQQLEEVQKVQQRMSLKALETQNLLEAINSVAYVATYDMNGIMIDANDALLKLFNVKREDVVGRYQGAFKTSRKVDEDIEFQKFWAELHAGKTQRLVQDVLIGGKQISLSEIYAPILNDEGVTVRVLNLILDITDSIISHG